MSLANLFFNYHNDARSNKHKIHQGLEENIASIYRVEKQTFFFPVALQPYRALADRAAAAGQRS